VADTIRDDSDLKKTDRGLLGGVNDQIKRGTAATTDLYGGFAEAVARAFRAYNESITSDNVMTVGVNNGFLEGTVASYAKFFEEMATTARKVLEDLRKKEESAQAGETLNYAKLARMVAEELKSDPALLAAAGGAQGKTK
jgi:hypothetical protein